MKARDIKNQRKYFATDHDKHIFYMEDSFITFRKISEVIIQQPDNERELAYKEFMELPDINWDAFNLQS